jgi:hypothetical protein
VIRRLCSLLKICELVYWIFVCVSIQNVRWKLSYIRRRKRWNVGRYLWIANDLRTQRGTVATSFQLYYASNHSNGEKSHESLKTRSIFAQVNTQIIEVFLKVENNAESLYIYCPTFRESKVSQETLRPLKMRQIHFLETQGKKHQWRSVITH